jgi:hypothetical protein
MNRREFSKRVLAVGAGIVASSALIGAGVYLES